MEDTSNTHCPSKPRRWYNKLNEQEKEKKNCPYKIYALYAKTYLLRQKKNRSPAKHVAL